ncbi:hypothetical protein [Synechococcus phage BUCT-ZZ01]|nr:hypothetical protein [Synechococcus phage BUCT-ZZ01]
MSRTYRRKDSSRRNSFNNLKWKLTELFFEDEMNEIDLNDLERIEIVSSAYSKGLLYRVTYKPQSALGKKVIAKHKSDSGSHDFKEPGPRWHRRMTRTVPNRRHTKRELHKYMTREEYEPIVFEFLHKQAEYWT